LSGSEIGLVFHTGMVVDDIAAAMRAMSDSLGVDFAEPTHIVGRVELHGRVHEVGRWVTYSRGNAHAIELIQPDVRDEVYFPKGGREVLHHVGIWVEDLAAASSRFEDLGFKLHMKGPAGSNAPYFAFYQPASGAMYVELLAASRRPAIDRWRTGGGRLEH
jgi:hypothetical protein